MQRRPNWIYVLGVLVLAFGMYLIVPDRSLCNPTKSIEKLEQKCEVSYQGVEGKNALEILKSSHQIETQSFSFGEMVQSIDGVKAPATHFLALPLTESRRLIKLIICSPKLLVVVRKHYLFLSLYWSYYWLLVE